MSQLLFTISQSDLTDKIDIFIMLSKSYSQNFVELQQINVLEILGRLHSSLKALHLNKIKGLAMLLSDSIILWYH